MKSTHLLIFLFAFVLISCNPNRVFEEHSDPSGNLEWNKSEIVKFDVQIEDVSQRYNIFLALRYAHGFMYTALPVAVTCTFPDGKKDTRPHVFRVRNEDGSYNGEGSGDIWDLEEEYLANYTFPQIGTYTYEIRQVSENDKIHMVMEVGLIVDKVVSQP